MTKGKDATAVGVGHHCALLTILDRAWRVGRNYGSLQTQGKVPIMIRPEGTVLFTLVLMCQPCLDHNMLAAKTFYAKGASPDRVIFATQQLENPIGSVYSKDLYHKIEELHGDSKYVT